MIKTNAFNYRKISLGYNNFYYVVEMLKIKECDCMH